MKKDLELFKYDLAKKQLTMCVKVRAGAKENSLGEFIFIDDQAYLKISIKAIAEAGKANQMIIAYLSGQWKIPQNNIEIIQGKTINRKVVAIRNIEEGYMEKLLKITG